MVNERIKITSVKISRIYFCNEGHEGWSELDQDRCTKCGGTAKETGVMNEVL